jgi:hypothetical protein
VRVLLVAYDFPPIPSPQSLRWAYLVRELALAGHEVHVLAPDVPGYGRGGLPELPPGVRVHRVYPGPLMGLLAARQRRQQAAQARFDAEAAARAAAAPVVADAAAPLAAPPADAVGAVALAPVPPPPALNWKGRLRHALQDAPRTARRLAGRVLRLPLAPLRGLRMRLFGQGLNWKGEAAEALKRLLGLWMFPDARAEWMPWARRRLDRLLAEVRPDAVITSHEPANSIELGLHAKRQGFRWIADLGDPVLAPYTPPRFRDRAFVLERALCERADIVTVTSVAAAATLEARHALPAARCALLTQGFDPHFAADPGDAAGIALDPGRLELLYTGSFYSFRRIGELLDAVLATPGARLNIATIVAPPEVALAARDHPERVRLLGFLAHRDALALQRRCDVLVNLANDDPVQIPGKLYEYLGAGRPVLHLGGSADDAAALLLARTGVGVRAPQERAAIAAELGRFAARKSAGGALLAPVPPDAIEPFRWDRLAERVARMCAGGGPA